MKLAAIGLVFLISFNVYAEDITCTLQSGEKKASVVFDFSKIEGGHMDGYSDGGVYDLSFSLEMECEGKSCDVYATFDSGIVEDEVGQTGFNFKRDSGPSRKVWEEPLTETPDGKPYQYFCYYNL